MATHHAKRITEPRNVMARPSVHAGESVITASGVRATIAFVDDDGVVWAWVGLAPMPRPVIVRCDAWGGESDLFARNAA